MAKIAIRIENVTSRSYSSDSDYDENENTAHFTSSFYNLSKVISCDATWELNLRILKLEEKSKEL